MLNNNILYFSSRNIIKCTKCKVATEHLLNIFCLKWIHQIRNSSYSLHLGMCNTENDDSVVRTFLLYRIHLTHQHTHTPHQQLLVKIHYCLTRQSSEFRGAAPKMLNTRKLFIFIPGVQKFQAPLPSISSCFLLHSWPEEPFSAH